MIDSISALKEHICADRTARHMIHSSLFVEYMKGNIEEVMIMRYQISLRIYEYVVNKFNKGVVYFIAKHLFYKRRIKTGIYISPGCFGPGLNIVHLGYIWVDNSAIIGKNCTVLPRVLLGKKYPGIKTPNIIIGDNCYIGTNTTILGPVKIGNNVTIGAGSVVVNDIPDNCVVVGSPAKVIKYKETND